MVIIKFYSVDDVLHTNSIVYMDIANLLDVLRIRSTIILLCMPISVYKCTSTIMHSLTYLF